MAKGTYCPLCELYSSEADWEEMEDKEYFKNIKKRIMTYKERIESKRKEVSERSSDIEKLKKEVDGK